MARSVHQIVAEILGFDRESVMRIDDFYLDVPIRRLSSIQTQFKIRAVLGQIHEGGVLRTEIRFHPPSRFFQVFLLHLGRHHAAQRSGLPGGDRREKKHQVPPDINAADPFLKRVFQLLERHPREAQLP